MAITSPESPVALFGRSAQWRVNPGFRNLAAFQKHTSPVE